MGGTLIDRFDIVGIAHGDTAAQTHQAGRRAERVRVGRAFTTAVTLCFNIDADLLSAPTLFVIDELVGELLLQDAEGIDHIGLQRFGIRVYLGHG